ncbi:1704_t:CDS:2 [Diversispora eburnea]|uniref:1704_t:CDS:1 n=1 Tax=Diversispora eburnea TaxID=1213867 RepID=A0A9N8Z540_9GLOM|nr:1704_t:CDS:2 [Diversispora eburnea]
MGESSNTSTRGRKRKNQRPKESSQLISPSTTETDPSTESLILTASPLSTISTIDQTITQQPSFNESSSLSNEERHQFITESRNIFDITAFAELFAKICGHFSPNDLLSLVLVCRKFREYLCNPNNRGFSSKIWKTSRLKFLRFLQTPPPIRMSEKDYIVLRQLDKGCQFCRSQGIGIGIGFIKVYWEFRVRCCEMCFDKRTTRRDILYIDWTIPDIVLRILPYVNRGAAQVYWTNDVIETNKKYDEIIKSGGDVKSWANDQQEITKQIMSNVVHYEQEEHDERIYSINEIQHVINRHPQSQYLVPTQFATGSGYNRSQFVITSPTQQLYPTQFVPRINRQMVPHWMSQMQQYPRY